MTEANLKINLTVVLRGFDGKELNDGQGSAWTLRAVLQAALARPQSPKPGEDMLRFAARIAALFRLGKRVADEDEIALTAEQVADLKRAIAELQASPVICGQAIVMLDPHTE